MSKSDFATEFKNRTKYFSIEIIKLYRKLPKSDDAKIVGKQLIRAATSVAANYRAACRARSDNEFYSKISIVVEEADETVFWMEILTEADIYRVGDELMKEGNEILAIAASSRKSLKNRLNK